MERKETKTKAVPFTSRQRVPCHCQVGPNRRQEILYLAESPPSYYMVCLGVSPGATERNLFFRNYSDHLQPSPRAAPKPNNRGIPQSPPGSMASPYLGHPHVLEIFEQLGLPSLSIRGPDLV